MLCRENGATAAYTPMFHSRLFAQCEKYRKEHWTTCAADRPLFVQARRRSFFPPAPLEAAFPARPPALLSPSLLALSSLYYSPPLHLSNPILLNP